MTPCAPPPARQPILLASYPRRCPLGAPLGVSTELRSEFQSELRSELQRSYTQSCNRSYAQSCNRSYARSSAQSGAPHEIPPEFLPLGPEMHSQFRSALPRILRPDQTASRSTAFPGRVRVGAGGRAPVATLQQSRGAAAQPAQNRCFAPAAEQSAESTVAMHPRQCILVTHLIIATHVREHGACRSRGPARRRWTRLGQTPPGQ
jgi:hypothetical protein